jgi:uridine phosphorylase
MNIKGERVYHLGLARHDLEGAAIALLPGDPFRVPAISAEITRVFGGEAREVAWYREFRTCINVFGPVRVVVTSTGIGGPSASIALEELAMLGVTAFIRVGTSGAIQKSVKMGDVVITTGAVRLDGASTHYAPREYPAVAHFEIVQALVRGAEEAEIPYHAGVTASSDTFYPGQERYESFTGYVPRRFQGALKEWQKLHVLNCEMESSTVLTLTSAMGLRGGCVSGILCNRLAGEAIDDHAPKTGEENAVAVAVAALRYLIGQ